MALDCFITNEMHEVSKVNNCCSDMKVSSAVGDKNLQVELFGFLVAWNLYIYTNILKTPGTDSCGCRNYCYLGRKEWCVQKKVGISAWVQSCKALLGRSDLTDSLYHSGATM